MKHSSKKTTKSVGCVHTILRDSTLKLYEVDFYYYSKIMVNFHDLLSDFNGCVPDTTILVKMWSQISEHNKLDGDKFPYGKEAMVDHHGIFDLIKSVDFIPDVYKWYVETLLARVNEFPKLVLQELPPEKWANLNGAIAMLGYLPNAVYKQQPRSRRADSMRVQHQLVALCKEVTEYIEYINSPLDNVKPYPVYIFKMNEELIQLLIEKCPQYIALHNSRFPQGGF